MRTLILLLLIWILSSCANTQVPTSIYYTSNDNKNVKLTGWKYADYKETEPAKDSNGFNWISITVPRVGEYLEIRWENKRTNKTETAILNIKDNLPFNMRNAEVRLTFTNSDEPEVYVFYEGPDPFSFFWFKERPYSYVRARRVHPDLYELTQKDLKQQ